ncbi:modification methylase StsI (adenine-specificmethyltransferase StsI) (M.StsI) [Campylobacter geochelonis]|nr:modification methylase StsI (adenine-specificmethyltransferase StsI) (M.StsI) [Campylobacter geochelonis]
MGRNFKDKVKQVIANDIEYYSYVLNRNYIENRFAIEKIDCLMSGLNKIEPKEGFIYKNYCFGSGSNRQYFSDENGKKIDAIRQQIQSLKNNNSINDDTYFFLLCSLLESADKVANTASVYGAFLKNLKPTARLNLELKPANFIESKNQHIAYNRDSNELIKQISGDILYLDPPYNARQYGANYHLLNTIALYDKFIPKGKTGLRDYNRSKYCSKNSILNEFDELIKNANFKYIFLSYNNEGLLSLNQIKEIMSKYGEYGVVYKEYQRFKADKDKNRNHKADKTVEFLHILEKRNNFLY